MRFKAYIPFLVLTFAFYSMSCALLFAQKAEVLFQTKQYKKAIPVYEKMLKKDSSSYVMQRLAECYYQNSNYEKSEGLWYKLLEKKQYDDTIVQRYVETLKYMGEYDRAMKTRIVWSEMKEKSWDYVLLKHQELMFLSQQEELGIVFPLQGINSRFSEFSPCISPFGLSFCSEQVPDLVEGSRSSQTEAPYLSLMYSKETVDSALFSKTKLLPSVFQHDFHAGPIAFSGDGKVAFITRVDNIKKGIKNHNKPQLFMMLEKNHKWSKAVPFEHNQTDYSYAHACLNEKGDVLIFSSDMPGGFGGKDLYISKKTGETWSMPENLGKEVNTPLDEVFPYLWQDKMLYFSSNGHNGFGGLDLFVARPKGVLWGKPQNLRQPINSKSDDFGICFKSKTLAYFSSNREGGVGKDDIYGIFFLPHADKTAEISGVYMFDKIHPAKQEKLQLLNQNGEVLALSITDESGEFTFSDVASSDFYQIKTFTANLSKDAFILLTDQQGQILEDLKPNAQGVFSFVPLPMHFGEKLSLQKVEEESFSPEGLFGRVLPKLKKDLGRGLEILILDSTDHYLFSIWTDSTGHFALHSLPKDKRYKIRLKTPLEGEIDLSDAQGLMIAKIIMDGLGKYKYQVLSKDPYTLSLLEGSDIEYNLSTSFYGKITGSRLDLNKLSVFLINDQKETIPIKIDHTGFFAIDNLPLYQGYKLAINQSTQDPLTLNILGLNSQKQAVEKLLPVAPHTYFFQSLPMEQKDEWPLLIENDKNYALTGNIFQRLSGDISHSLKIYLLNEQGETLDSTLINRYGDFLFKKLSKEKTYALKLAETDGKYELVIRDEMGREYRLEKGLQGLFMFNKLSYDKNASLFLEELPISENAAFKGLVYRKLEGDLGANLKVFLFDDRGNIIDSSWVDHLGFFEFNTLPKNKNFKLNVRAVDNDGLQFFELTSFGQIPLAADQYVLLYPWESLKNSSSVYDIIHYEFDQLEVILEDIPRLEKLVRYLEKNEKIRVEIHGHTDNKGTNEYNETLSLRRGHQIKAYLTNAGIPAQRVIVKGFGENYPLVPNFLPTGEDHPEGRSKNRRSEIYLVP